MSFYLSVFDPIAAPKNQEKFLIWFNDLTEWTKDLDYNNPSNTSIPLQKWFNEVIKDFPPMNGPLATEDYDNPKTTDYSIRAELIYASFAWSVADEGYSLALKLAKEYQLGFYALDNTDQIWIPDELNNMKLMKELVTLNNDKGKWWKLW